MSIKQKDKKEIINIIVSKLKQIPHQFPCIDGKEQDVEAIVSEVFDTITWSLEEPGISAPGKYLTSELAQYIRIQTDAMEAALLAMIPIKNETYRHTYMHTARTVAEYAYEHIFKEMEGKKEVLRLRPVGNNIVVRIDDSHINILEIDKEETGFYSGKVVSLGSGVTVVALGSGVPEVVVGDIVLYKIDYTITLHKKYNLVPFECVLGIIDSK